MATPTIPDWTIVIVGQWNPHIFSPDWVGRNLFHVETVNSELLVGPVFNTIRHQSQNLILIPGRDRLVFNVNTLENAVLLEMESAARETLSHLPHTPVRALGFNFGFLESEPTAHLLNTFNLNDNGQFVDEGYFPETTEISREFNLEPCKLRLKMALKNREVKIHFNFNHSISSVQEFIESLGQRILEYRQISENVLERVLHLTEREVQVDGNRES